MRKEKNIKLREMIKEYGVKNLEDINNFVKMLTLETIQEILDEELTLCIILHYFNFYFKTL